MRSQKDMCPGSQTLRQSIPEDYTCPKCREMVELWANEEKRRCSSCGTEVSKTSREKSAS
ncbi:MAG: hypothetical protein AAB037_00505 [Chloroflexota bacterium]